jgi:hypothetical protein
MDVARRPSPVRMLLLFLIAAASMLNGLYFSPFFDIVLFIIARPAAAFFIKGQAATFYLTGLVLWLFTLVLAGIPAALWERVRRLPQTNMTSLVIWLIAAMALSIPSVMAAYELFFDA